MRRFFAIGLALCLCSLCWEGCSTVKEVTSARHVPQWVWGVEKGYLIVSAQAPDIETAKNKALNEVKRQMVNAIAETVRSASLTEKEEVGVNNLFTTMELYRDQITTQSGNIPFLSQVTLANAADYYWSMKVDKNTEEEVYTYHLKYPFTRLDQDELIEKFEAQEEVINNQLADFEGVDLSSYASVEQMEGKATALRAFQSTLMENDVRRKTCDQILRGYKAQVERLSIQAISVDREQTLYEVYYGERKMDCNVKPYLRSKCLEHMNWQVKEGVNVVTYDYAGCFDDEQNYIDITLTVLGKKINHRFYIL